MKDEQLREKTAEMMSWSLVLQTDYPSRIKLSNPVEPSLRSNIKYEDCWESKGECTYLKSEWNPLENLEHFFMVIEKLDLMFIRAPEQEFESQYMVIKVGSWEIYASTLKELMDKVIKKICEAEDENKNN